MPPGVARGSGLDCTAPPSRKRGVLDDAGSPGSLVTTLRSRISPIKNEAWKRKRSRSQGTACLGVAVLVLKRLQAGNKHETSNTSSPSQQLLGGIRPGMCKIGKKSCLGGIQPIPRIGRNPWPLEPTLLEPTPTQKGKRGGESLKHAGFSKAKQLSAF
eukprot:6099431-Amphidinium_carterae.1